MPQKKQNEVVRIRHATVEVQRHDERVTKLKMLSDSRKIHFLLLHHKPGTPKGLRMRFGLCSMRDDRETKYEFFIVAGDLNEDVGAEKANNYLHGVFGSGKRNTDGERIPDYAVANGLATTSTCFVNARPTCMRTTAALCRCRSTSRSYAGVERIVLDAKATPTRMLHRSIDLSFVRCALKHQGSCIKKDVDLSANSGKKDAYNHCL